MKGYEPDTWLRKGTMGGLLWIRWCIFWFHNMMKMFLLAKKLSTSQGLCSIDLIIRLYIYVYIYIYMCVCVCVYVCVYRHTHTHTGLFKMIVGVLTTCHLVLQMQSHVISFYGFTSTIRFLFLLFPQLSRNWRYESEPPLKQSPLTYYKQFGTKSIIVLMFVESQRAHHI